MRLLAEICTRYLFFGFKGSVRNWIISAFNRFRKCDLQKCKYEFSPLLFEAFQGKTHPKAPIYCGGETGGIVPSGVIGAKTPLVSGADESGVEVGLEEVVAGSAPVVSAEPGPAVRSAQAPIMNRALASAKPRAVRLLMR